MIFINLIKNQLSTKIFGQQIEYHRSTNSTNDDLWSSIHDEINEGYLVITDNQKAGRGRRGNVWLSESGSSLLFSFLIKPNHLSLDKINLLPLLTGVAVVQGISNFTELNCKLKWPNDIYIDDKKVGGILAESKVINEKSHVVMGIGINVNELKLPENISNNATSLRIIKNKPIERESLLAFILNEFEILYSSSHLEWIYKWNSHCIHLNSIVKFHYNNKTIEGTFLKINKMGQALLNINGNINIFSSGVVELT